MQAQSRALSWFLPAFELFVASTPSLQVSFGASDVSPMALRAAVATITARDEEPTLGVGASLLLGTGVDNTWPIQVSNL